MDEKGVIVDYLKKCNAYAEASIARKIERGEDAELDAWRSYITVSYTHLTLPTKA